MWAWMGRLQCGLAKDLREPDSWSLIRKPEKKHGFSSISLV